MARAVFLSTKKENNEAKERVKELEITISSIYRYLYR